MPNEHRTKISTVISGSYRKHLQEIIFLKIELEKQGVDVLSPSGEIAINPDEEFIILDSDPVTNPELLQSAVFSKIRNSTFLVLANFHGYIGVAAAMELGYAIREGIKIYACSPVSDPNLAPYCSQITNVFPGIDPMNNLESLVGLGK